jgi:hypothetical protein
MELTSSSFVAKVQTFQMFLVAMLAIKEKKKGHQTLTLEKIVVAK